ncbi:Peptidase, M16 family [Candidatus Competibacter denitrificans Run_A_D11]|uniref:Peptidase, M16 family n=1 Tax=Candidatus Competibacter denitrificans Run_A_D11 TaxID=1400863 RepID=W6M375_9GAMM|nr:pitrilysin family protein [Candidatus Competibacter denitrificans]CDI02041.1 Peptidase, M16 family [Candidatus Competibacter denitrificans Run_A_D11]HRC69100.1 pitrilysin family protein [Candidatus Competibacter denitrificans]
MAKILNPLLLLCLLNAPSAFTAVPVHEFTLGNGLKVLVREDHRAPVVVSQVWYKVGSSYEPSGLTGISHLLEHLMFKGTPNVPGGEFSRQIAANGGDENAFTSHDYTAYFQTLEKERLELSFRLEADRMRHLLLKPEDVSKEAQVVAEERRLRTDDQPDALTQEQFLATAYITSPYRHPIIGWMQDIQAINPDDLRRWYQQWYAPNNATLVVVGDVDPAKVRELAEKHFGPLAPSVLTLPRAAAEIPQQGERRIVVKTPAEVPYLTLGYKAPTLKTATEAWEPYALAVLDGILDGGTSARFSRNLIRGSQVAAAAGTNYNLTARLEELFVLAGNPAPGRTTADLEKALRAEVARLREELVSTEELARVIAQVVAADVYRQDSMFYQGMRLGTLETVGLGWNKLDDYVQRIQAVTPEQVRDVARKYLTDDRLTVAILEPLPLDGRRPKAPAAALDHAVR